MSVTATRLMRKHLELESKRWPVVPVEVPKSEWPYIPDKQIRVFRSNRFLVQIFQEDWGIIRLTISRTTLQANSSGRWAEDISWDDLQAIKRLTGYGDRYAIEIYPREVDVVNVASMRHLWLLPEPLQIGWFAGAIK